MSEIPTNMKAIVASEPGGPEVLTLVERPVPQPSRDEVLVKVAAAGINRPDVLQRRGVYPPPPGAPDILGLEIAGTVIATGEGAESLMGRKVCALVAGGGYAEYCVANAGTCLIVPEVLRLTEAAAMPEAMFTVWINLFERGFAADSDAVLVHRGTSAEIPIVDVMRRRLTLTGSTLRQRSLEFKTMVADELGRTVWPYVEGGRLKPVIDKVFPLADAAKAHARMEAGDHVGKIVLQMTG